MIGMIPKLKAVWLRYLESFRLKLFGKWQQNYLNKLDINIHDNLILSQRLNSCLQNIDIVPVHEIYINEEFSVHENIFYVDSKIVYIKKSPVTVFEQNMKIQAWNQWHILSFTWIIFLFQQLVYCTLLKMIISFTCFGSLWKQVWNRLEYHYEWQQHSFTLIGTS